MEEDKERFRRGEGMFQRIRNICGGEGKFRKRRRNVSEEKKECFRGGEGTFQKREKEHFIEGEGTFQRNLLLLNNRSAVSP